MKIKQLSRNLRRSNSTKKSLDCPYKSLNQSKNH